MLYKFDDATHFVCTCSYNQTMYLLAFHAFLRISEIAVQTSTAMH